MTLKAIVHKAVEPNNLSKAGKAHFEKLIAYRKGIIMHKMDGVYCQIVWHDDQWVAISRTGERLTSVSEDILYAFQMRGHKARRYVGELWMKGQTHAELNGRARRKVPQYQQLWLTDSFIPGVDERFEDRLYASDFVASPLWPVNVAWRTSHRDVAPLNLDDLYSVAKSAKASAGGAYDGLIYRDPNAFFVEGAGKGGEIVKIKPREAGDFKVVGVVEGKGKAAGMAGALVLDLGGGVTCEVGTGMDDGTRKDYWQWWCVAAPYRSRIAEVEYLTVTKDGKLREPSFKSTRWDKVIADVIPGNIKGED